MAVNASDIDRLFPLDVHNINNQNILQCGNVDLLMTRLNARSELRGVLHNTTHFEMVDVMNCISQTLSSVGQWKGKCESVLKDRFIELAIVHPTIANEVLNLPDYCFDRNLTSLREQMTKAAAKADYLAKALVGRMMYHLLEKEAVDNWKFGIQLFAVNGLFQVFAANNETAQNIAYAIGIIGTGVVAKIIGQAALETYWKNF